MGGVDKTRLEVHGRSLLDRAIAAVVAAGCAPVIVMGPHDADSADSPVLWREESRPFGGPAAAIVEALPAAAAARREWTVVLACDLPSAEPAVELLMRARTVLADSDGVCLVDASGRPQWLTAIYRTAALQKAAIDVRGNGRDIPVRVLLSGLSLTHLRSDEGLTDDIDTWDDYERITKGAP